MPYRRDKGWWRLLLALLANLGASLVGVAVQNERGRLLRRPPPAPDPLPEGPSPHGLKTLAPIAGAIIVGFLVFLALYAGKRERDRFAYAAMLTGGDPARGPALMLHHGCAGCHVVPGVRGPRGRVGPSLEGVGARVYIAGMVTNTPRNLVQWIVNPKEINPRTAMPVTGISDREARDVAAYLLARR